MLHNGDPVPERRAVVVVERYSSLPAMFKPCFKRGDKVGSTEPREAAYFKYAVDL